jgi:hypothetical protein
VSRASHASLNLFAARTLSSSSQGSARSDSWLASFARELRAEMAPARDVPGTVQTSLIDPERWERLPPDAVRFAARKAFEMFLVDWRTIADVLMRRPPRALEHLRRNEELEAARAASAEAARDASAAANAHATGGATASSVADSAREAALHVAAQLSSAAHDQDLRSRLAAMGTEALKLARDALDEFLVGYQVRRFNKRTILVLRAGMCASILGAITAQPLTCPLSALLTRLFLIPGGQGRRDSCFYRGGGSERVRVR